MERPRHPAAEVRFCRAVVWAMSIVCLAHDRVVAFLPAGWFVQPGNSAVPDDVSVNQRFGKQIMMMKPWMLGCFVSLLLSGLLHAQSPRVIKVDRLEPTKDMSCSLQGADAESFQIGSGPAAGVNLKSLLTTHRQAFANAMKEIGSPVLRMADMSRYCWESAQATAILRHEKDVSDWWYSPQEFHSFCRENNIKIIGFFDTHRWYDAATQTAVELRDPKTRLVTGMTDSQLQSLVEANRRKIQWVKDHGYSDLYVAWEIGNENYAAFRDVPKVYARMAQALTDMARQVDPSAKTSITVFVCAPNDDNLVRQISDRDPSNIQDTYERWKVWSSIVLKTLGEQAKKIPLATIHLYGTALAYNANQKGLATHARFLESHPNAAHMQMIATEWRHTSGDDLIGHRRFKTAALWKAKFTMSMMSHPKMSYTGVHEFSTFSGLIYINDGSVWRCQSPVSQKPLVPYPSKPGSPVYDIGPFGPVMSMANDLIRTYPMLLEHRADLGENSSVEFSSKVQPDASTSAGRDIDYLIASSKDGKTIGGMVVNTFNTPVPLSLKGRFSITSARTLSCPAERLFEVEIPGEPKAWRVDELAAKDGVIHLPPLSVTYFHAR